MIRLLKLFFDYKAFVVAALLTFVLSSMIYHRISILTSGTEITLKSRPIDPRDFFRGNYVVMNYEISQLNSCKVEIKDSIHPSQLVFVQLEQKGDKGYWQAVAVSTRPLYSTKTTTVLSGFSRSNFQPDANGACQQVRVRYGLEKYFAPKKRAKELEDMRRGFTRDTEKETAALTKLMLKYRKELSEMYRRHRQSNQGALTPTKDTKIQAINDKIRALRDKINAIRESARRDVAVLVRVSKSGEGAISGLMIDGKKVYEEPLL